MKLVLHPKRFGSDVVSIPPVSKVCMYMLGTARADARVMKDATALVAAGFAVTIVDVETERTRPTEEDIHGIHIKHIIMPSWSRPTRFKPWFLVKLMSLLVRGVGQLLRIKADMYHAHVERSFPACYLAARLRHKPFILDAPELSLSEPRLMRWRRLNKLAVKYLSYLMSHSTGIIATSRFHGKQMSEYYFAQNITIVRNMPPYREISSKSNKLHSYLQIEQRTRIALYQGNIQADRGLHVLVRAASFLEPDIVIVMMGKAVAETRSQLEALITSEGVADRVKIIPPVPYEELLNWTASADIGLTVLPPDYSQNIRGCLPNKFFEYLMAGVPVLTSRLEAIVEIIETYDVGKVASSLAPEDLAAAMNAMLADSTGLARMRQNALEVARREFSWEKESQKLIQLYRRILTHPDQEGNCDNEAG